MMGDLLEGLRSGDSLSKNETVNIVSSVTEKD